MDGRATAARWVGAPLLRRPDAERVRRRWERLAVRQQLAVVEAVGLQHRPAVGVEPLGARSVVVQLDAVRVGVGEVDGDAAAVVGGVVDRMAVVEQAAHGAAQLAAVGVEERDVVEARVPGVGGVPPAHPRC